MADDANPCINLSQAIIQYTLKPSENQSFSVFRGYENVTSQPTFIGLQDVLKTSSIHVLKDVFRVTISRLPGCLQDVLENEKSI